MVLSPAPALAAYGPFEHGSGIKALGFGGVSVVGAEDSYTLAANPSLASGLNQRYDVGLDWPQIQTRTRIDGNLLGPDDDYASGDRHYFVPQFGAVLPLSDRITVGLSGFAAGLGTDFEPSAFTRFGGGADRTELTLGLSGVSSVVSYQLTPAHAIGLSLNLGYQLIEAKGLPTTFALFSQSPKHFTNQGFDGALAGGFSLGWHGRLTSWLEAGASYRSKTWAQRFDDYAGLLPDGGRLELPATYAAGVAIDLLQDWTVAVEVQRTLYAEELATGNGINQLYDGNRFGSDDGPGFGWNNQTIVKLGIAWQATPDLRLRTGYSRANQLVPSSETLLASVAPAITRQHITAGLTWALGEKWEVTGYAALAIKQKVQGDHSIPLLVGGGEANLQTVMYLSGISFGRNF